MALINCPECETEVSERAAQCPKCAHPIAKTDEGEPSGQPAAPQAPAPAYVPTLPPKKFLAGNALACCLLIGLGFWLFFVKIPQHNPAGQNLAGAAEAVMTDRTMLTSEAVTAGKGAAILLIIVGFAGLPQSFRETGRLLMCRKCGMQVVARRKVLGRFACERCESVVQGKYKAAVALTLFLVVLGACGVVVLSAL